MPDQIKPSIFWEIHSGLPREGPGDNASTRRAFSMAMALPAEPRILDVGCGPGMQTLELEKFKLLRLCVFRDASAGIMLARAPLLAGRRVATLMRSRDP